MTKFFLTVYDYFQHRRLLLFALLTVIVVCLAVSAFHIDFKEDISRFLPETKVNQRINDAWQYIASSNNIIVYCNNTQPVNDDENLMIEEQIAAIDALAGRIQNEINAEYVKNLLYIIDPTEMMRVSEFITDNLPYFLDDSDYVRMDSLLTRENIEKQILADKNILSSTAGIIFRQNILADPLQIGASLLTRLQSFNVGGQFQLIDDHIFNTDNQAVIIIESALSASDTENNAIFLNLLKNLMTETESEFENITFESFGAAEIGLSNSRQIKRDTLFSVLFAIVLILALLIYTFRSGYKILLIFIPVVFGGLFALAALNVISGDVSVIAVGISSIMFGIAINYPLHFLEHHSHTGNSRQVIKDIIEPLTIGNITTVGAFLSLVFIGSDAMRDLGLFASLLLTGTILFVLFFLPHLLKLKSSRAHTVYADKQTESALNHGFKKKRLILLAVVALTVVLSFFSSDSQFDANMQNINYMTDGQKKSFEKMTNLLNNNRHVMYYVTESDNLENALEYNEHNISILQPLIEQGLIHGTSGVGNFFPSRLKQQERIKRWNAFWGDKKDRIISILRDESRRLGFRENAFASFEEMLTRDYEPVNFEYFNLLRETVAKNYILQNGDKSLIINSLYINPEDAQSLETHLNDISLSAIAFDAGSVTRRMIASLSDNFNYVLYVCGFIVFAFLIFSLGRIELSIIAFTPLALSWIWILGLMNIFDIHFNIVNIILATFIFGQGDDYTIFMTEGLMYEYAIRRRMLASYRKSIALSALIMFIGMGMLIFARHPALRSLAEVTVIGMFSVVLMAFIFPPALFKFLTLKKGRKRTIPLTLKNLSAMIYSFFIFLMASLTITVFGSMLFVFGKPTEKKKLRYHKLINKVMRCLVYRIPYVKTTLRNLAGETFERPGVIICNHQSHIDLACVMMLTPKLIVLTNDWVWNSPFYGRLIKYADYYPVSNGMENAVERLRGAVERGYSIVVFPEGTRSADCNIGRFHRGAFYLAERLNIDIIPVFIHGVGHVLPKEDFLLRKGSIDICIMPRITADDERFSNDYSLRSLQMRRYYQDEYKKICAELETPEYYADMVIHNYIYKGAAIEREVRRNLRRHNNYAKEIAALPDEGEVTVENAGYGEYPLLAALVKKNLHIIATDPDPDRIAIASNCAIIPNNLTYL